MIHQAHLPALLLLLVMITGCSTGSEQDMITNDAVIGIVYVDNQGDNLLNPNHPDAITEENTNLYFMKNGESKKIYEGNLDHPKHFFITDESPDSAYTYNMRLFPNIITRQEEAVTLIEFNDSTRDTIKVRYNRDKEGNTSLRKVWYNDEAREDHPLIITKNMK